jgi:hypothetical protein
MIHNLAASLIFCCFFLLAGPRSFAQETSPAHADKKADSNPGEKPGTYYLCKLNNVVRTIRVVDKNGVCETTYTKDGIDKVVGRSGTSDRCFRVISNIKTNLEKASWKCRDISQARVSSSLDDSN